MKAGYDTDKKVCCDCQCDGCFEDEKIEIEKSRTIKLAAAVILLLSLAFVAFSVFVFFGG